MLDTNKNNNKTANKQKNSVTVHTYTRMLEKTSTLHIQRIFQKNIQTSVNDTFMHLFHFSLYQNNWNNCEN